MCNLATSAKPSLHETHGESVSSDKIIFLAFRHVDTLGGCSRVGKEQTMRGIAVVELMDRKWFQDETRQISFSKFIQSLFTILCLDNGYNVASLASVNSLPPFDTTRALTRASAGRY